ncbi:MAG: alpha/beta hydrolase [Anaerolineales bacterium]
MNLNVRGHSIYYEQYGPPSGPPVVLLHHGLGTLEAWEEQIPAFVDAGLQVIAYDRWGYGRSDSRERLTLPYFEDDLDDLLALLQALGIHTASLIGHSDGGTLSLYFAEKYPHLVERMIIVAAHIYVEPKMAPGIEELRAAFEGEPKFREGMCRVHGEKWERVFWNWYEGWVNEATLNWDMRPLLHRVACPVLVVQGQEDEHATPRHAIDLASAIPSAQLWLVEGGSHMLPRDLPETFNQRVLEFLAPAHDLRAGIFKDNENRSLNV